MVNSKTAKHLSRNVDSTEKKTMKMFVTKMTSNGMNICSFNTGHYPSLICLHEVKPDKGFLST